MGTCPGEQEAKQNLEGWENQVGDCPGKKEEAKPGGQQRYLETFQLFLYSILFCISSTLSFSAVDDLVVEVGINQGNDPSARRQSIRDLIDSDTTRIKKFGRDCVSCQAELKKLVEDGGMDEVCKDVEPATPINQPISSQRGDDESNSGQWTLVVYRKKS
jgi:hypothetical protein